MPRLQGANVLLGLLLLLSSSSSSSSLLLSLLLLLLLLALALPLWLPMLPLMLLLLLLLLLLTSLLQVLLFLLCSWGLWAAWGFICSMLWAPTTASKHWLITSSTAIFWGPRILRLLGLLISSPTVSLLSHFRAIRLPTCLPTISPSSHPSAINVLKPSRGELLDPGFGHMPAGDAQPRIHCSHPVL
jgi:hypothetical protein